MTNLSISSKHDKVQFKENTQRIENIAWGTDREVLQATAGYNCSIVCYCHNMLFSNDLNNDERILLASMTGKPS